MANLKQDLLNYLGNEKYYDELELARLAGDPNTNYKEKVKKMVDVLKNISALEMSSQLVGRYFQKEEPANGNVDPSKAEQPQQPQQPGQTHTE